MVGGMLGDFVRGTTARSGYPQAIQKGIELHRHIDTFTDSHPLVSDLRKSFPKGFRRYAGIIMDLAFDHMLALQWSSHYSQSLQRFDRNVRNMLTEYQGDLPAELWRFMDYAKRRGLFQSYEDFDEILVSLKGVGQRLRRPNPLHQAKTFLTQQLPDIAHTFDHFFPALQQEVVHWRNSMSTTTGS